MHITEREIKETLEDALEPKATKKELSDFKAYLNTDIQQWLRDNAKSFVRDKK
jgi:hypothetical protein